MKKILKNLKLETKLSICLILMSLIIVGLSSVFLINAINKNNRANIIWKINSATEPLFASIEGLAFERGRTYVVLSSNEQISINNKNFIINRQAQVDTNIAIALERLNDIDPSLAKSLATDYNNYLKLRNDASAEFDKNSKDRNQLLRREWLRKSTNFMFKIKNIIVSLRKKEQTTDLYNLYQRFQLDCLDFRIYSGYSSSVLTASLSAGDKISTDNYNEFFDTRLKADYIWNNIESEITEFKKENLLIKRDIIYNQYYNSYRPLQDKILKKSLNNSVAKTDIDLLSQNSIPALDSIFQLINEVSSENKKFVMQKKEEASLELNIALIGFIFVILFLFFTWRYFKINLFQPLEIIVKYLKIILNGQKVQELEDEIQRNDEIGMLIEGVKKLQSTMQEEIKLKQIHEKMAITDKLTGAFNRQMLDQGIDKAIATADRYHEDFSLLCLDLDHFKKVNDTWGHNIGDEILKQTVNVVKNNIRSADVLVRFGGEEFVVLMPQTSLQNAIVVGEKIRTAIATTIHPIAGSVTVSIGVAQKNYNEKFDSWYKRGDEALYKAKKTGRNKVIVATAIVENENPVLALTIGWRQEWESGNSEIDSQHKKLLEIANDLFENIMVSKADMTIIMDKVEIILTEIKTHFAAEEVILKKINYNNFDEHVTLHHELYEKALILKQDYVSGKAKTSKLIAYILDDVVLEHMLSEDQKFFPYL